MRVRWNPGARQQYLSVLSSLASPEAERRLERETAKATQQIELFPESGRMHSPPRNDMRIVWVERYRMVYLIDMEDDEALIISFLPSIAPESALD